VRGAGLGYKAAPLLLGTYRLTTIRISTPEEIAARAGEMAPALRLPERASLFAEREMRLRQLAAGHAMREYLIFIADIAHEQQGLLSRGASLPLPDADEMAAAVEAGAPPLPAGEWPRAPVWRDTLRQLVAALRQRHATGGAGEALARLAAADDDWLEQQADRLLHGVMLGLDLAAAPLVAAALQVLWAELLLQTSAAHATLGLALFPRLAEAGSCPACGSRPTASVVRIDGDHGGQRYLQCSLCSLQWHHVRVQCTHCGKSGRMHFQELKAETGQASVVTGAADGAVRAECCDDCGHYLKMVHMDKDAHAEAVADDLASVTLDLLVAETGAQRHGVNLMLLFGDPEADTSPQAGAP
jgi:FdhE protein